MCKRWCTGTLKESKWTGRENILWHTEITVNAIVLKGVVVVMGNLSLFSDPGHLSQLSDIRWLFRFPNDPLLHITPVFNNSAKFSIVRLSLFTLRRRLIELTDMSLRHWSASIYNISVMLWKDWTSQLHTMQYEVPHHFVSYLSILFIRKNNLS